MTGQPDVCALAEPHAVTKDAFLGGAVMARQPGTGYRAGLDAVLLAAAVDAPAGQSFRVLDLGAGVGIVGLCIARRLPDAEVTLLERQPELVALASRNIAENALAARVRVLGADLTAPASEVGLPADSFDHVVANPPFFAEASLRLPRDPVRAASHAMPDGELEVWLRVMARLTRPGGRISIIHKADALPELLAALRRRFGAIALRPVHPRRGAAAHRLLIQAVKGSRAPLQLMPPLFLHDETNAFLPPVAKVLRGPVALADITDEI